MKIYDSKPESERKRVFGYNCSQIVVEEGSSSAIILGPLWNAARKASHCSLRVNV
jgi:hypothetical protein